LCSDFGQATYTCVLQYNLVSAKDGDHFGWESNCGSGGK